VRETAALLSMYLHGAEVGGNRCSTARMARI
jgi:hypothetical protein